MNPGNVNMANLGAMGGPVGGAPMPMMNNGAVAPQAGLRSQISETQRTLLNTYIYEYFLRFSMYDCARALVNSDHQVNVIRDGTKNGDGDAMDADNKDDIEGKIPDDLPAPRLPSSVDGTSFLHDWFSLFWEMYQAQRGRPGNAAVHQYVNHTQSQSRMKQNQQQQELLRTMRPDQYSQMLRMQNGANMAMAGKQGLARAAMANNNPQAVQLMHQKQNQMQRDPSGMDGDRQRPSSPGSTENAPSPSKRPRLGDGTFNQNGPGGMRPVGGMPGQPGPMPASLQAATQLLMQNGINPSTLSPAQLQAFSQQTPSNQQKSIQTYSQNLGHQQSQQMGPKQMPNAGMAQGQGSPMMPPGTDGTNLGAYYNTDMGAPGGMRAGPAGAQPPAGSNHALQDYQMQLMLLEQQNKKRLMMARQEQDTNMGGIARDGPNGGPGGPAGANGQMIPEASPQGGARSGASPNSAEQMKRGTPQISNNGMGSPLPDGAQPRDSPNAMGFMGNEMNQGMAPQFFKDMAGNMVANGHMNGMRPPSSHPGQQGQQQQFSGQVNPQMMAAGANRPGAAGPANAAGQQWPPGGPNGNQMAQQGPQAQGQVQGTPQQRNSMPPPSGPAAAASNANNRTTASPQQTPSSTPSQANKPAPKKKEKPKGKTAAQKKSNQNLNAAATPATEPAQEPETPATPATPSNAASFKAGAGAAGGPVQNGQQPVAAATAPAAAPTAPVTQAHADPAQGGTFGINDGAAMVDFSSMDFANPLTSGDVLNDFDFDSFLHDGDDANGGFDFNAGFGGMEGGELAAE